MRTFLMAAQAAAMAALIAGCGKPDGPSAPAQPVAVPAKAAAASPAGPGPIDEQTLNQALERTRNRFAELDLNGDGKLTKDELGAAAFGGADANGDGVLTRQEVEDDTRERVSREGLIADFAGKGKARPAGQ
ncbi:MAG TPA: hypothetical protein VL358_10675 [Caulobacteraceae bacterium]|nr:hypothetical protein [Caulobacteraceae bacterium]